MKRQISEIQIIPIKPINGLIGFASVVFDNSFYLGSIGIYSRPCGGFRLTYPTRKGGIQVFHPINKSVARQIEQAVISKLQEIINK